MIKIKICDVAPRSGCAYYRGLGVFNKLRYLDPEIQIEYTEVVSWTALSDADILFLMRPCEPSYSEAMEIAQSYNIPVWIDFDDCLHEVPPDNPSHEYHKQKHLLENIEYCIKYADVVTFSTQTLKDYYSKIRTNSIVIENAFNNYNYTLKKTFNDTKIISWRGTNTHRKDLLTQKDGMINISKKYPDWQWVIMGCTPWYVTDYIKNVAIQENIDIIKYNRFIINLQPGIHLTPLVDSTFNRSKSNISWIESTSVGACNLAPKIPEFEKPGIINYKSEENFEYLFEKLIKSKKFREDSFKESSDYIEKNLLLSIVNKKRLEIIRGLVKKDEICRL